MVVGIRGGDAIHRHRLSVAVGGHAFYLFTMLFLGPKLASATETYGVVGVFATLLFWLYLVGRLVIGGATLNAALADRRSAPS